jgi:hypothetical protein
MSTNKRQSERSAKEPHPEQEGNPEGAAPSRRRVMPVVVIGAIILILVVLHLVGAMSLHRS